VDKRIDGVGIGVYEIRCGFAVFLQYSGYKCNIVVEIGTALADWQRTATQLAPSLFIDAPVGIKYSFGRECWKVTRDHALAF